MNKLMFVIVAVLTIALVGNAQDNQPSRTATASTIVTATVLESVTVTTEEDGGMTTDNMAGTFDPDSGIYSLY